MHLQFMFLALVAPLALSLPQPIPQGETAALVARQESGNSTGWGNGEHHGEEHPHHPGGFHPERDLVERQESSNSSSGGQEHHRQGKHYVKGDHQWGNVEKRIQEGNGTTGGHTDKEKYWPDGHRGPHGQHERAVVDDVLDKRQGNATESGEEWRGKHEGEKSHFGHEGHE